MKSKWILMTAFAAALSMGVPGTAQSPAAKATDQAKSTTAKPTTEKKAVKASPAPTEQEIADAKAKGMVWVNTKSKVYHKDDSRYFGKTKQGKFMTEDDAKKAGFKAAKERVEKNAKKDVKAKPVTQATK